jgi:hypothetical protein
LPTHRRRELRLQRCQRTRDQLVVVGQQRHRLRRLQQQVDDVPAGREQVGEALGDGAFVAQQTEIPVRRAEGFTHLPEGQQPAVGVGRIGEPREHHREQRALDRRAPAHPGRQGLEVAQRAGRVQVAECLQPRLRGFRCQARVLGTQPRDGRQERTVEELLVQPTDLARVPSPLLVELLDR